MYDMLNLYNVVVRITRHHHFKLEFQEMAVSPGKTEVKQGKLVEFISPAKGSLEKQNINHISTIPKFTLGVIQIKVKSLSTSF